MKKKVLLLLLSLIIPIISGCTTNKMYYFGDYSETLYAYEKNQNDESLIKHLQELDRVIQESKDKNLRVPPGIYAEFGYLKLKMNKPKEAVEYFNAESQLYPEGKHLMDRLINKVETQGASESNSGAKND